MPWLMWPMAAIDALLTPRRWAPAPLQGLATRISAALTRDTLPIARWLGGMLDWAARSYAMGQAPPEVIAMADRVTGAVTEDGLVDALQEVLDELA